jgi:DNA topoisomerase-3
MPLVYSSFFAMVIFSLRLFDSSGLVILKTNYLDVYPYDKWSDHPLPEFKEGESFRPTCCEMKSGKTSKPHLLTEADLVTLMDKNGIGMYDSIHFSRRLFFQQEWLIAF